MWVGRFVPDKSYLLFLHHFMYLFYVILFVVFIVVVVVVRSTGEGSLHKRVRGGE